jgi:hypothetical protein
MTCDGSCRLCFKLRKDCECIAGRRGGKVIDDFHPAYAIALEYIRTETFFGKVKHEQALALIQAARLETLNSGERVEGFARMRLDKDARRLVQMADGRLYATRAKMSELAHTATDEQQVRESSNASIMQRYRDRILTPVKPI